ncbi:MAG TPA: transcriptional regulator [Longimicrobium sp.]|nr:transcriptional regulator [Longimicrobium sp.]
MSIALDFTKPHLLRSDEEYDEAVREVDALLDRDPRPGTEEFDRLEFLSVLIEEYEDEHEPRDAPEPTPQAVVDFMLEQNGLTRSDLTEAMGGKSRVSEFFAGKRDLSRDQIRGLRSLLGIPADLLI